MELSNRIRQTRLSKNYTQAEISAGIISTSHYSNIENGRSKPGKETLLLLAKKLSVPERYFINCHEDSSRINDLLQSYASLIELGDRDKIELFFQSHKEDFQYIQSINQELCFQHLRFLDYIGSDDLRNAKILYSQSIEGIDITQLSMEMKYRYFYVSGLYFYLSKKYNECIIFYDKALSIVEKPLLQAKLNFNIALASYNLFQYDKAFLHAEKASILYLTSHNWRKTGDCYNFIAAVLRKRKSLSDAREYINKGFDISNDESYELRAKLHHNLSLIKIDQESYEDALDNIEKSINLKEKQGSSNVFVSYRVKWDIYLLMKNIPDLKRELTSAHKYINSKIDEAHYLFIKAQMHYLLEEYLLFEQLMNKCITIYSSQEAWVSLKRATKNFTIYLSKNKKYKKAYEQQKLYIFAFKKIYLRE